jgi:MFS family permease
MNCTIGLAWGSYGAILVQVQHEFATSRALASAVLGLETLAIAALSPLVGAMLNRVSIRAAMMVGATLNVVGYLAVSLVHSIWPALFIFSFVVGPGMCLLTMVPVNTLVTRWFERDRGRILGLVHMPIFLMLGAPISAFVASLYGPRGVFLMLACVFACLVPVLLLVVDRPEMVGQRPLAAGKRADASLSDLKSATEIPLAGILRSADFWLLSLGAAVLSAGSAAFTGHIIANGIALGLSLQTASFLLTAYGAGTICGSLILGWLSDRVGSIRLLIILGIVQAGTWWILSALSHFNPLIAASFVIGTGTGAIIPLHSVTLARIFGQASFSKALGWSYLVKMPFTFAAAPLAGAIFDATGSYRLGIDAQACLYGFAALLFAFLLRRPQLLAKAEIGREGLEIH